MATCEFMFYFLGVFISTKGTFLSRDGVRSAIYMYFIAGGVGKSYSISSDKTE